MKIGMMKKTAFWVICAMAALAWTVDLGAQCPLSGGGGSGSGPKGCYRPRHRMSEAQKAEIKAKKEAKAAVRQAVKDLRKKAVATEINVEAEK